MARSEPDGAGAMERALKLARRADYGTSPNPMVGAVLLRDGEVVGEGYHEAAGRPHAEQVALERAGESARGAELFVTLEPCCTSGRTGPCTELILAAGVRRVHAAVVDPNPAVNGGGLARLRQAGVEVIVGEAGAAAARLIEAYSCWVTSGRPFVTLKLATSLDGKVATASGDSRWITGEESRRESHRLRRRHDAVMVGVGTVLADDPELTVRHGLGNRRQPIRVVVDSRLRTPASARVLRRGRVWIAAADPLPGPQAGRLRAEGAELLPLESDAGRVALPALLRELGRREVTSVLVEGGPTLVGSLVGQRLADRVVLFVAPLVLGGQEALSAVGGSGARLLTEGWRLRWHAVRRVGGDLCLVAEV